MRYENFEKVKSLVDKIDKNNAIMKELKGDLVNVKVFNASSPVMTIGAYSDCEHDASQLAINFVSFLKEHYSKRLLKLHSELASL